MPKIAFAWDKQKAIEAAFYLVGKLGSIDRVALTKLLYYADRAHFLEHGGPITGDVQRAMKHGPVPFETYRMLSGERLESVECMEFLHEDDWSFTVRKDPGTGSLSPTEITILDRIAEENRGKDTWTIAREAESLPEYTEVYQEDRSEEIPYEVILKCNETGDGSRFRKGRPVISREMMAKMPCPFSSW